MISDIGAEGIGKMIEMNTSIEELYLRWNKIKSKGGIAILNGLKQHTFQLTSQAGSFPRESG